jgi:hypothetical protein
LIVDIGTSGASDQVKAIAASRPDIVTAVAARVLKETAPDEFRKWLEKPKRQPKPSGSV